MSKKKIIITVSALVVVAAVLLVVNIRNSGSDEIQVQTSQVGTQKIVQTVNATGRIQPQTQVNISADISAKIIELPVEEGDWVEKGQLLVRLDQERFSATVERAAATKRSVESNARLARENMIKAEKDYQRAKELFAKQLESQANLDQMYAAFEVEKARYQSTLDQVAQAEAALKEAQDSLDKTSIYAPMTGTISVLNKELGEIALGSQFQEDVIMIVSDLKGMEALVDVDENDIVAVSIGDSATIEVDALTDDVFHGVITEIANSAKITGQGTADQKTEFEVKIWITDPGNKLRPGMTASSDIVTDIRDNALAVPIQSVTVRTLPQLNKPADKGDNAAIASDEPANQYKPDKDGFCEVVFVMQNGSVVAKQVKTGIQSDTHIEIVEGLQQSDEVVTGSYRAISKDLQNGAEVVVNADNKNGPNNS